VRIVGAHPMHVVPTHTLKPHPNVGLDVFHHVANVEFAVGVRQSRGDEKVSNAGRRVGHGAEARKTGKL
jgi:hypothetical protein